MRFALLTLVPDLTMKLTYMILLEKMYMIVVISLIESAVVKVVRLSDSAMARRALGKESEAVSVRASAEREPRPRANNQQSETRDEARARKKEAVANKEQARHE